MTIDQRLRDDLRTAADRIADDRADVFEVIRAGRRRRVLAPAVAAIALVAAVAVAGSLTGPLGGSAQTTGSPAADEDPSDDSSEGFDDQQHLRPGYLDNAVVIFLCDGRACPTITDGQRQHLEDELDADADILAFKLETKQQAYDRFVETFSDEPSLVESVDPDTIPASLRVIVHADADGAAVADRYGTFAGVEDSVWHGED